MAERLWSSNVFRLFSCLLSWGRAPEAHCALWARLGARILVLVLPAVVDLVLVEVAVLGGPFLGRIPYFMAVLAFSLGRGHNPKKDYKRFAAQILFSQLHSVLMRFAQIVHDLFEVFTKKPQKPFRSGINVRSPAKGQNS